MEVAELISFGLTEKEISNYLDISAFTVKIHKRNLFNKTGCRNIADVTRWYIQRVSGIRIQPRTAIRNIVSVFMLILILFSELADMDYTRYRVRIRSAKAGRTKTARRGARRSEVDYYIDPEMIQLIA